MTDTNTTTTTTSWMHIGLHGHSVGTFTIDLKGIRWQSAMTTADEEDDVLLSRFIPAKALASPAQWTIYGRSAHVRIHNTLARTDPVHQKSFPKELRFDGFPKNDFDKLKQMLSSLFRIELVRHYVSSCGASFGNVSIENPIANADVDPTHQNLVFRQCILQDAHTIEIEEGQEFETKNGEELLSFHLADVSQCVLPGNSRNEIELQFLECDTVEAGTDQLVAIRFYIPPNQNQILDEPDNDDNDNDNDDSKEEKNDSISNPTPAQLLQQRILSSAKIKSTSGNVIAEFNEDMGTFLTPRGRYSIELYDSFLRMRGNKYDYKIKYDDVSRLFLLPRPDDIHYAFVIALDRPIRQGQQRYQMLVWQTTKANSVLTLNLDEKTLTKEYNNTLQPVMQGALCNLIAKTFKAISNKKVFVPGNFANAVQQSCVKCALRANEGHLYPLEKSFVFIHKPPVLIRFEEVESVEFQRYHNATLHQGSTTRNFDLCITLHSTMGGMGAHDGGNVKEYVFSGIDRSDYPGLYNFLSGKRIKIKNLQDAAEDPLSKSIKRGIHANDINAMDEDDDDEDNDDNDGGKVPTHDANGKSRTNSATSKSGRTIKKNERDDGDDDDEDEDEEDEDYGSNDEEESDDDDDDDDDDEEEEGDDSDIAEHRKASSKGANVKKRPAPEVQSDDDDDDDDSSSATSREDPKNRKISSKKKVTLPAKTPSSQTGKSDKMKKVLSKNDTTTSTKKKREKKDPNAPKRASTAFLYYSNEMRPLLRKSNPSLSFGELGKLIGQKFKELSGEDKKKYEDKAKADKARYDSEMKSYVSKSKGSVVSAISKNTVKISKAEPSKKKKYEESESDDDDDDEDED